MQRSRRHDIAFDLCLCRCWRRRHLCVRRRYLDMIIDGLGLEHLLPLLVISVSVEALTTPSPSPSLSVVGLG
jgi:hypothetical protein